MGILFFNWYGYQLLSTYLQDKAGRRLEASLDKNSYDEAQLISVKVPITTLSYYNSNNRFERVDGQVEIGGVQYKYVKRRLFKDSLELLCIPDQARMGLQSAKNEFFRQVNDLQQQGATGKKAPATHKGFSADYCLITNYDPTPGTQKIPATTRYPHTADRLTTRYTLPTENPPDQDNAALS